ncbi:phosphonate metabolism transcriptional regulator PhnF [Loktanella sp. D2R18]|uniref:phosphonate metabolism transcriptional regulator PhnF n=1 Tax=Rhodobacterales TaxID=204455 RepID=UPI000DEB4048|nr:MULTISPECIES: phosphonate metabolism transcriptional regulator PhnF [Rhodobacterales]MDO6589946.1 phosphonate metabolism transcriptional regulator PhnF [Yoonia sp. 1_MG-2023]RBW46028.1 phosphonate metabolism transcriptional regulator PhnF [Loktanella sp. D2R18]
MTRQDKWRDIRAHIEQDIMDGVLEPGAKLPTEPELATAFAAGRHSVRRALAELAKQGLISVEQGRGTFVQAHTLLEYTIGARTRLRKNLGTRGAEITGEALGSEQILASPRVAQSLQSDTGAKVIATKRMTLVGGVPVSFGTLYHDAARFPDFAERRLETGSVTATYATYGINDYLRGNTQMHARPARAAEAQQLRQHPEMPVIVVRAVDTLPDGTPIAFSQVIWSAARVKFNMPTEQD